MTNKKMYIYRNNNPACAGPKGEEGHKLVDILSATDKLQP
jgi:hypothetical protein